MARDIKHDIKGIRNGIRQATNIVDGWGENPTFLEVRSAAIALSQTGNEAWQLAGHQDMAENLQATASSDDKLLNEVIAIQVQLKANMADLLGLRLGGTPDKVREARNRAMFSMSNALAGTADLVDLLTAK